MAMSLFHYICPPVPIPEETRTWFSYFVLKNFGFHFYRPSQCTLKMRSEESPK